MKLAEVNIEVECLCYPAFLKCRPYLAEFDNPDIIVKASKARILKEYNHFSTYKPLKNIPGEQIENSAMEYLVLNHIIAERLLDFNIFQIHGSAIAKNGFSYIFVAPSGVGKTTRTRIWLNLFPDSIIVNGDKPLIKITSTEAIACGSPWCGKEGWNTNIMVPLRAIFLLERADNDSESSIEEVSLGKAFPFLLQETYLPENPELMRKSLQLLKALEGKIKLYKFCSKPTPESIQLAYETAKP